MSKTKQHKQNGAVISMFPFSPDLKQFVLQLFAFYCEVVCIHRKINTESKINEEDNASVQNRLF